MRRLGGQNGPVQSAGGSIPCLMPGNRGGEHRPHVGQRGRWAFPDLRFGQLAHVLTLILVASASLLKYIALSDAKGSIVQVLNPSWSRWTGHFRAN
ncbi:hypothetical protein [Azospirillum palustre]